MQKHILKRLSIFSFWLVVTLIIIYVKNGSKDISELLFSSIFAVFFLVLISIFFLLYESVELRKQGNLQLYKANRIIGFSLLSILTIVVFIFVSGAIILF
jgi:hypothetical protein